MSDNKKKSKKLGCIIPLLGIVALIIISSINGIDNSNNENYNDNSLTHQICAKNYFRDYLKKDLKDAKSYEEVDYTSTYNYSKECYEVTIKYRATNSFGAKVLEQSSGEVKFSEDYVTIKYTGHKEK